MKTAWIAGAALLGASLAGVTAANAIPFSNIGVEDPNSGITTTIFGGTNFPPLDLASDGEDAFHPFDITHDVSDAVRLNPIWSQDAASSWEFWGADLNGNQVWDLPAAVPGCGNENEPKCEPTGIWDAAGFFWTVPAQGFTIWETDGTLSDVIIIGNTGPGGSAQLSFYSDPSLPPIPEPSTWAMIALGFAGLGLAGHRARRANAAHAI